MSSFLSIGRRTKDALDDHTDFDEAARQKLLEGWRVECERKVNMKC